MKAVYRAEARMVSRFQRLTAGLLAVRNFPLRDAAVNRYDSNIVARFERLATGLLAVRNFSLRDGAVHRVAFASGTVEYIVRDGGLTHRDLFDPMTGADVIALFSDCVASGLRGEARAIQLSTPDTFTEYTPIVGSRQGHAREIDWRLPGTVTYGRPALSGPRACQLHCQWAPGSVQGRDVKPKGSQGTAPECDDQASRDAWLAECLARLEIPVTTGRRPRVAFAWGEIRGARARDIIARFSIERRVDVLIVQRTAQRSLQLRGALRQDVEDAASRARAYVKQCGAMSAVTRETALALCDSLKQDLLKSLPAHLDTDDVLSHDASCLLRARREGGVDSLFREAFAARPDSEVRGQEVVAAAAARQVQLDNELHDSQFRAQLKAKWAAGELSTADIRDLRDASLARRDERDCACDRQGPNPLNSNVRVAACMEVISALRPPTPPSESSNPPSDGKPPPDAVVAGATFAEDGKRIRVSSADGGHTPLRLGGLMLIDETSVIPGRVDVDNNMFDGGSGTTILGKSLRDRWKTQLPDAIRSVTPLPSSVRRIWGIGALNEVEDWVAFTLDFGGRPVDFVDVPVLRTHDGLLIGNDFMAAGKPNILYGDTSAGGDGTVVLRNDAGCVVSSALPIFHHAAQTSRSLLASVSRLPLPSPPAAPVGVFASLDFTVADDGSVGVSLGPGADERIVDDAIECVDPIAFTSENVRVEAFHEALIKCRVPASIAKGVDVALLPLEDSRFNDLGLMVAPCVQTPVDGFVYARVINVQRRHVSIPLLTPFARYIIDPRTAKLSNELDIEEVLAKINTGPQDDESVKRCRAMLETRLALFRNTLNYAHPMQTDIPTTPGAVPPAAQNRVRPQPELKALEEMAGGLLKQDIIEDANRSPYNALPMIIYKPDGSLRPAIDFRGLNLITERDSYPLPNIEANLAALGRANWFTTVDLLQGFLQLELSDSAKIKTAFTIGNRQYQFKRMPMGLTSSPSSFMRVVDAALRGLPPGIAYAYV